MDWQPIEKAKTDGTPYVLLDPLGEGPGSHLPRIWIGAYVTARDDFGDVVGWGRSTPTHFVPLSALQPFPDTTEYVARRRAELAKMYGKPKEPV